MPAAFGLLKVSMPAAKGTAYSGRNRRVFSTGCGSDGGLIRVSLCPIAFFGTTPGQGTPLCTLHRTPCPQFLGNVPQTTTSRGKQVSFETRRSPEAMFPVETGRNSAHKSAAPSFLFFGLPINEALETSFQGIR